jgi:plasmid maintenance system antidote protein VapI
MNIGKTVKTALLLKDKDVPWLAKKLGVTRGRADKISAASTVNSKTISRLADAFDMSESEFIALGEQQLVRENL